MRTYRSYCRPIVKKDVDPVPKYDPAPNSPMPKNDPEPKYGPAPKKINIVKLSIELDKLKSLIKTLWRLLWQK